MKRKMSFWWWLDLVLAAACASWLLFVTWGFFFTDAGLTPTQSQFFGTVTAACACVMVVKVVVLLREAKRQNS